MRNQAAQPKEHPKEHPKGGASSVTQGQNIAEMQRLFAAHVLLQADVGAALTSHFATLPGWDAQSRLSVHRNTTVITLREALQALYPVLFRLVGEDFFAFLARRYIAANPPETPVLQQWGDLFPDFIETLPEMAPVPYGADVARLEWAWSLAQNSPNDAALRPELLAQSAELASYQGRPLTLGVRQSMTVVQSQWPVATIWQAHQQDDPPELRLNGGEVVAIWRHRGVPQVLAVPSQTGAALAAMQAGVSLDDLLTQFSLPVDPSGSSDRQWDPSAFLSQGLALGWFSATPATPAGMQHAP